MCVIEMAVRVTYEYPMQSLYTSRWLGAELQYLQCISNGYADWHQANVYI